jgi:hypothetical protein
VPSSTGQQTVTITESLTQFPIIIHLVDYPKYNEGNLTFWKEIARKNKQISFATGWMTRVPFPVGTVRGFFLFTTTSRPAMRPTQPPI